MKKSILFTISIILFSSVAIGAGINANSLPLTPLVLTQTQDLSFGDFHSDGTIGTVTINPDGTRLASANIILDTNVNGTKALFTIAGIPNQSYILNFGNNTVTDGTTVLTVDNFTHGALVALDGSGNGSFGVGGRLNITVGATNGAYTAPNINITANYQ